MIYVTHDQVEALTMADKIVVMKLGVIQQIGGPLELYNNPDNKFVAGFIGSPPMNFINTKVEAQGDKIFVNEGTFKIEVTPAQAKVLKPYVGKQVTFGIRPEDVEVVADKYREAQVRSNNAYFDKNSWEAERNILHLYVELVHKDLIRITIIEIDVNRSNTEA